MVADNLDLLVLEVCDVYSCRSAWSAVVDSDLLWLQPLLAHLVYCIWPITFLIYMQSWTFSIRQRSEREGSKEWICEGTCSIHNIQWSIMRNIHFLSWWCSVSSSRKPYDRPPPIIVVVVITCCSCFEPLLLERGCTLKLKNVCIFSSTVVSWGNEGARKCIMDLLLVSSSFRGFNFGAISLFWKGILHTIILFNHNLQ